jgi:transcriptional regulator with XRE-family HTH domain
MLKVKELAEAKGWNISRLSEASGVSYPQTLSIWHNRTRRYDVETLKRIADALDVHVWQLYEGSPPATAIQERIFRVVKSLFPKVPEHHQLDMARWLEDLLHEDVFEKFLKDQAYHRYKTIGDRWEEEAREREAQANGAPNETPTPDKTASPTVDADTEVDPVRS